MTINGIPINQKASGERNKKVWLIKDKNGSIIDSFRQKIVAVSEKKRIEKIRFEKLYLERDNSYRENLKRQLSNLI